LLAPSRKTSWFFILRLIWVYTCGPVLISGVIALNLQFTELNVKLFDKVLKHVAVVVHQLHRYLFEQHLCYVLVWILEVLKKQDKNLFLIPRNLDQVNLATDFVKVTVEDGSLVFYPIFVVPNIQRWWSALSNYTNWL
jgi:hypothetical protein